MIVKRHDTDHFNERPDGVRPSCLILHYTEKPFQSAHDHFTGMKRDQAGRVSPHYMIDEDGTVHQYVDEDQRAWHAGVSYWDGITDVNAHSIGIELVNPGHGLGYRRFPSAQMTSLVTLCREIKARYEIPAFNVLGHSDVAPDRKIDPGELFDWKLLARQGVGLWPAPTARDRDRAVRCVHDSQQLRRTLTAYGYNPDLELEALVSAFQRHFYPDVFFSDDNPGVITQEAATRLCALVRQKKDLVHTDNK